MKRWQTSRRATTGIAHERGHNLIPTADLNESNEGRARQTVQNVILVGHTVTYRVSLLLAVMASVGVRSWEGAAPFEAAAHQPAWDDDLLFDPHFRHPKGPHQLRCRRLGRTFTGRHFECDPMMPAGILAHQGRSHQ